MQERNLHILLPCTGGGKMTSSGKCEFELTLLMESEKVV